MHIIDPIAIVGYESPGIRSAGAVRIRAMPRSSTTLKSKKDSLKNRHRYATTSVTCVSAIIDEWAAEGLIS